MRTSQVRSRPHDQRSATSDLNEACQKGHELPLHPRSEDADVCQAEPG